MSPQLHITPEQQKVIDLVADQALQSKAPVSGKLIRSKLGIAAQSALDSLAPIFLRQLSAHPNDQYKLTLAALLASNHSSCFANSLRDVLLLFARRFQDNPDFTTYSSEDLQIPGVGVRLFATLAVIDAAELHAGGSRSEASFSYNVPGNIERLAKFAGDSEAFLAWFGDRANTKSGTPDPTNHLPHLPLQPDSIQESQFFEVDAGTLSTEARVTELIDAMWRHPEADFLYYHEVSHELRLDPALSRAKDSGDILFPESQRRYFRHPQFPQNFVHIVPIDGINYRSDWERIAVQNGPEFWRVTLKLSQRKRDELDTLRRVQIEDDYRQRTRHAKHNFDVFLSHASPDSVEARLVHDKLVAAGRSVFLAPKNLNPGDDFAEEIRLALSGSRELWLLMTPASFKSHWVSSEWGAAWVLGKRIVPILHRCSPEDLPPRLAKLHCIDLHRVDEAISSIDSRGA